jgi:lipopolysaccharide/colanic/teichoic acid biosynthesis glycosyltransferase
MRNSGQAAAPWQWALWHSVWPPLRPHSKRAFDVVLALLLLALTSPLLLLLAGAARLDGGPALYAHHRVGRGGRAFRCLKFRTMVPGADRILAEHLARDPAARAEWEATRKLRRDPRITRVGRLLRSTSLDEMPQIVNVLRGEMSFVGPRPVVPDELDEHYGLIGRGAYLSVRPGITGLWQVSGRSDTGYEERVALDIAYVRRPSFRQDLVILLRTVGAVLRRQGAY